MTYTDGLTPDVLETIVHAALKAHDLKGVEAALMLMAVRDPYRCEQLRDTLLAALAVAEAL